MKEKPFMIPIHTSGTFHESAAHITAGAFAWPSLATVGLPATQADHNLRIRSLAGLSLLAGGHSIPARETNVRRTHEERLMVDHIAKPKAKQ